MANLDLVEVVCFCIGLLVYAMFSFARGDTKRPILRYVAVYLFAREIIRLIKYIGL